MADTFNTFKNQIYLNLDEDVGLNQNGSLIIGTKTGANLAFDANEIMARNNSTATTLYLNNEGGLVQVGNGGLKIRTTTPILSLGTTGVEDYEPYTINSTSTLILQSSASASIIFGTANTWRARFNSNGHFTPQVTDTYNIGASSLKWNTIYAEYLDGRARYVNVTDTTASSTKYYLNFTYDKQADSSYSIRASDNITTTNGNLTISKSTATTTYVEAANSLGSVLLDIGASGNRGVYDNKKGDWIIYRLNNAATTYIPDWKGIGNSTIPVYFTDAGKPATIGTLPIGHGGTGSASQTANRVVYTNDDAKIVSGYHYVDSTHFAIKSTSKPSTTFYVNGTANFTGNVSISNSAAALILDDTSKKAKVEFKYNGFQGKYYGVSGVDAPATVNINQDGGSIIIGKTGYRTTLNTHVRITNCISLKSGKTYGTTFPTSADFPDYDDAIPTGALFFKKI